MKWTKPYYGVSHLKRSGVRWATIIVWGRFTEATTTNLNYGLRPTKEKVFFLSEHPEHTTAAKEWCERQLFPKEED